MVRQCVWPPLSDSWGGGIDAGHFSWIQLVVASGRSLDPFPVAEMADNLLLEVAGVVSLQYFIGGSIAEASQFVMVVSGVHRHCASSFCLPEGQ